MRAALQIEAFRVMDTLDGQMRAKLLSLRRVQDLKIRWLGRARPGILLGYDQVT